jgi:predicted PurR-regulated permease PerM
MSLLGKAKAEDAPLTVEEKRQVRQVRGHILFFFAVLLALGLAWQLRHALGIIYVSALFAVVLMPVVQQIMRLRIGKWSPSRTVGVVVLVVTVFGGLTAFLILALPPVLHDMRDFARDLPARIPGLVAKARKLPMADKLGVDGLAAKAENAAGAFGSFVIASAPKWLARVLDLLTAMILCIYFMLEGEFAYFYLLALWPEESRDRLARTLIRAETRMSKWLIGQGSLMLILGVLSTLVFWTLHVRYFFLLGLLMGMFNIIPVAGGVITIVLVAAVAALDSWGKMAGVLVFYAIYVQLENAILTPRIMKTSVNLAGLAVLIALLCGTTLAGITGAMVAVPTAALIAVLMDEYMVEEDPEALMEAAVAKESA